MSHDQRGTLQFALQELGEFEASGLAPEQLARRKQFELMCFRFFRSSSGVAHFVARDDSECLAMIRELMSFLPLNNLDDPPRRATSDHDGRADAALDSLVPADPMQPYDIKDVIHSVADDNYFFEVHEHFAKNIVV